MSKRANRSRTVGMSSFMHAWCSSVRRCAMTTPTTTATATTMTNVRMYVTTTHVVVLVYARRRRGRVARPDDETVGTEMRRQPTNEWSVHRRTNVGRDVVVRRVNGVSLVTNGRGLVLFILW